MTNPRTLKCILRFVYLDWRVVNFKCNFTFIDLLIIKKKICVVSSIDKGKTTVDGQQQDVLKGDTFCCVKFKKCRVRSKIWV